jgi:DNA-binding NarL/FixJ family response regulator
MRPALRGAVSMQAGWTVCGESMTALETLAKTIQSKPDVVLLDTGLPDFDAVEFTRELRRVAPASKVVVLSVFESAELAADFREAGANGYLLKSDVGLALAEAVTAVLDGRSYFKERMQLVVGGSAEARRSSGEAMRGQLTTREREVLQLLADGQSNKEVAASLNISIKTVETHRARIMSKLEVHSIGALVRYAIRNRLMDA